MVNLNSSSGVNGNPPIPTNPQPIEQVPHPHSRSAALPADPCPHCERGGTCDTAFCGRKRSSELMRLYGTAGVAPCEGPSTTAYAKQCRFYDVTVRGRRCEVTDHPDGRRAYFAWHEGADKLREVPPREAALRAEIDAAVAATYGVAPNEGKTVPGKTPMKDQP
jgi:hypothetical protein